MSPTFDITFQVEAIGTHGCQRDIKDGEIVAQTCGQPNCPDCVMRDAFAKLKAQGHQILSATIRHWPGQVTEVADDLITGIRKGSFY